MRFGFELIEYIASLYNCEIEIIDNTEKSEQQELVEDLVQILSLIHISGIPMCPPEGDAGTGMVATNSVAVRTGNVSAGTSVFAMIDRKSTRLNSSHRL